MDKKLIREKFKNQNYKFIRNYKIYKDIVKELNKFKDKKKKNLLLYMPIEKEVDIIKYKRFLIKKYNLYIPKMQDDLSLSFTKARFPFIRKKFKVKESLSKIENVKIHYAIIPVLGVDKEFRRIGFGKGFYDRSKDKLNNALLIIFIQNITTKIDIKICNDLDIIGDYYISSNKKYKIRKEY